MLFATIEHKNANSLLKTSPQLRVRRIILVYSTVWYILLNSFLLNLLNSLHPCHHSSVPKKSKYSLYVYIVELYIKEVLLSMCSARAKIPQHYGLMFQKYHEYSQLEMANVGHKCLGPMLHLVQYLCILVLYVYSTVYTSPPPENMQ